MHIRIGIKAGMNRILTVACFVSAVFLAGPVNAGQGPPFDLKALPLDDDSLQALDKRHLRLAHRVSTMCRHNMSVTGQGFASGSSPIPLSGCMISMLDQLVAGENDPALSAYHHVMAPARRYDENRNTGYWRTVKRQREIGSPIPGVGKPE